MMVHGGNVYLASQETGIPIEEIIDFSASINPLGAPETAMTAIKGSYSLITHYPEPVAESLSAHIAKHLNLDPQTVVCGNGSTELIYFIVRALAPRRVLILEPTFSEYRRACSVQRGTEVVFFRLEKENNFDLDPDDYIDAMTGCDLAFLCNPNNPTGRVLAKEAVETIARAAQHKSCWLVLDEAFIDFTPQNSVADLVADNSHLIVLRSLTKFYALPGLRIGYGVFPKEFLKRAIQYKEPWTVNVMAQQAGEAALNDTAYASRTLNIIGEERAYFVEKFHAFGIDYTPSSANYYLIRIPQAQKAALRLRKQGILIRNCSDFAGLDKTYLRVAVRTRRENERLFEGLAKCME